MKTNICISLDHELVHALREAGGMSQTINTLLQSYIFGGNTKGGMEKAINERESTIEKAQKELINLKEKLVKMPKYVVRHG